MIKEPSQIKCFPPVVLRHMLIHQNGNFASPMNTILNTILFPSPILRATSLTLLTSFLSAASLAFRVLFMSSSLLSSFSSFSFLAFDRLRYLRHLATLALWHSGTSPYCAWFLLARAGPCWLTVAEPEVAFESGATGTAARGIPSIGMLDREKAGDVGKLLDKIWG